MKLMLSWNLFQDHEYLWPACRDHGSFAKTMTGLPGPCLLGICNDEGKFTMSSIAGLYSSIFFNVSIKIIIFLHCTSILLQKIVKKSSINYQWNIYLSEMSTLKRLMILNVCIEIFNVSLMLNRYCIFVSLMNRFVFWTTPSMIHQCFQCVFDWDSL